MAKFRDAENRAWEPEVNVVTISRVRSSLGINLLELLLPNNTLADKLNDPCLLVDIIYLLCKDQADAIGVDDISFGRSMLPDGIEDAWEGVLEGIVSFSPRGLRPAHQRVLDKAKKYQEAAAKQIVEMIAAPEFDARLDKEMSKRLASSPTESTGDVSSLPVLSESSQDETHLPV